MMAADSGALLQAKLVLLGDMGAGKSSLVLRFVKGQFFDYQARLVAPADAPCLHLRVRFTQAQLNLLLLCVDNFDRIVLCQQDRAAATPLRS